MTLQDIGLLRLVAQRIVSPVTAPEDAVRSLLAMQAQDYNGALWSIGLRTKEPSLAEVEKAITEHAIVRTWPMRGTLHFLHADDVHWMVDLLAPRATAAAKSRRINQLGLTDTIVDDAEHLFRSALRGGKSIVRGDVVELLQDVKGLKIDNQHTQHLMRNFGERGILCFGPNQGKQPTFVLLDEWVSRPAPKSLDAALAELARRYFISHGPASLKDFAGWGMLTMRDAKFGLAAVEAELDQAEIDGTIYYYEQGLRPASTHASLLLPGFDEYLLGYKDRSAVLPTEYANRIVPAGNGMFLPTVVDNGQVKGLWKRRILTKTVQFEYEPFKAPLNSTSESEKRYAEFLGKP